MGKVLLVVDDSITIRTAVELIFEGTEYRIVAKESGEAGLAWMRTHTPDLILVDERMPDMDGYEFGSQVKSNEKNQELPILLLACQDGPDESKADTADLDGYVNKPFGSQELVTLVEMLTGSSSISQMPLSFKEQLAQRQREKQARAARGGSGLAQPESVQDEQLSLEAALASVASEEKKEPKKDEPVVEIPIIENAEPIAPIRIESKSAGTATLDLAKPKPEPEHEEPKPAPEHEEPEPEAEHEEEGTTVEVDEGVTPEPKTSIPHEDLVERPPPRFPPPQPPSVLPDLSFPLPPRRETSPVRRPKPEPIAKPDAVAVREPEPQPRPPPPLPPIEIRAPSKTPDLMLNIEAPVEAASSFAEPIPRTFPLEPDTEIGSDVPSNGEAWKAPERAAEKAPERAEKAVEKAAEKVLPVPPPPQPSSSRGLLFALLALAVIGGLIAFYFVSQ